VEGNAHFQAYTCGIVRNATSFLLQGGLDAADVIVIPHTCDALQGMASVLKDFIKPPQPIATIYLPRGTRPVDRVFLAAELRRLAEQLAGISGRRPRDAELTAAIEREDEADHELRFLAEHREEIGLGDRDYFTLLRAREFVPAESFVELARSVPRERASRGGVPLMISGIVPEPMELFDRINEMGARVVADDLACCSRRLYRPSGASDPFQRMVDSLLDAPLDPTRGSPILERARAVSRRMAESGARGLLVYDVKFCEPELFDVPLLRKHLAAEGFPMLHVEFDMAGSIAQQTLTRIEAFVETLQ
jgi:benzoyl-CoA reductase/2-hydroxyglutaryl-CoA dehydratase subunit BcrC/BadD/HgdB